MRIDGTHRGLTLLETLVAAAIILTLIGVLATAGKGLRRRSEIDLTRSTMGVLETALEVYFDEYNDFVPMASDQSAFETLIGGTVTFSPGTFTGGVHPAADWRNAAMYYYLEREPKSRSILSALAADRVTGRDDAGAVLVIEIRHSTETTDNLHWIRVLDAWGTPLDYRYDPTGTVFPEAVSFPMLRSAGPDRVFNNNDDVTNQ